ncbi:unnamed protein product [Rotaria sp. Silwood1]|nr:unnamed protein product [Rotaria sp. Silwood1]CAF1608037.1 unnamed protein product [Rotaria sp. Silwood1]
MKDEAAHYMTVFKQLDSENELGFSSRTNSPTPPSKTRRAPQDKIEKENDRNQPVNPLVSLDDVADQTDRLNHQHNQSSLPSTTTDD